MWIWIIVGIIVASLVFTYALCRVAAMADLRAMHDYAMRPKKVVDPWEEPKIGGGIYDHELRGDFRG